MFLTTQCREALCFQLYLRLASFWLNFTSAKLSHWNSPWKAFSCVKTTGFQRWGIHDINRFCLKKVKTMRNSRSSYNFQCRFRSLSRMLACLALSAVVGPYSPCQPHRGWCTTIREIFLQREWINVTAPAWSETLQWLRTLTMSFGWASASPAGFSKCLYAPLNFKSVWIFGFGLETQDPGDSAAQNPDRQSWDCGTGARLQGDMQACSTWACDLPGPRHIFQRRSSDFSVESESAISYDSGYAFPFISLCAQPLSCVWPSATPWTVAYQAPMSMEFSRQEYWSGLPCPLPRDLPNPGIESASPALPALAGRLFTTKPPAVSPSITFSSLNLFCMFFFSSSLWNTGDIRPSLRTPPPLYILPLAVCPCCCGSSDLSD